MKKIIATITGAVLCFTGMAQTPPSIQFSKDSSLRALLHADSLKIEKQYAEIERWDKLRASAVYPVFNAGEFSGVVPVKDPAEIPDPTITYKLLFELTDNNADSVIKEANYGLVEVARIINLHVASGIPIAKILPVIVVHAGALNAFCTSERYKEKYKTGNPNLKLISELKNIGARFIACGQAMAFKKFAKEDMLPEVKISLTAQTVLSGYQLKGYVLYNLSERK
ncbi:DsrE family protein [Ferruginibacter paludis]|uniref:DsrE family protein n=1 Tax=Ferruginibacter paludis TaxID=1310417 RepID=UPI0025B3E905|nr:DsrE family protein [Ferruginibacter paludis]MDN3655911.1 DsrE family protein [Ferruginibacter paludis]